MMDCWPTYEQAAQHRLHPDSTTCLVHGQPFVTRLIDETAICLLLQGACEHEAD